MNPYEADPEKIPMTDLYADVPFYGRYCPKPDDFRVDLQHVNSQTTDSLRYWASVVSLCTEEIRIYPADDGGRDVFALGSVIVKSSHLHAREGAQYDFSYTDANEVQAIALAKTVLKDVKVPEIYFSGKIDGLQPWKCWSKQGFRVLDYLSHGRICQETRGSPTKNRPGRYFINFILPSPQRNFKLAPMYYRTPTYSVMAGSTR